MRYSPRWTPLLTVLVVAALSSAGALSIDAYQDSHIGDRPGAMFLWGGSLAGMLGFARPIYPAALGKKTLSFQFLIASAATMSGFFIAAIVDMYLHGGHNLFPIEFFFYFVYTIMGVIIALGTSGMCIAFAWLIIKVSS
jgi:hypothetical protein